MHLNSDALKEDHPDVAELLSSFAGLVLWQCGPRGDFLAWFRREVLQTVDWLGDQSDDNRDSPLSPRNSFAVWQQSVRLTGTVSSTFSVLSNSVSLTSS